MADKKLSDEEFARRMKIVQEFKDWVAEYEYGEFMMRGEEEVFMAVMDKLGVKLEPEELRDFQINYLQ